MKAYFSIILAIILWATAPVVVGGYREYFTINQFCFYFFGISAVFLGIITFTVYSGDAYVKSIKLNSKRDLAAIIFYSLMRYAYSFCFYYALQTAPRIEATIINYLWPILFIIFSFVLKPTKENKPHTFDIIIILISFFGASFIAVKGNSIFELKLVDPMLIFAFGAAIAAGINSAFSKHFLKPKSVEMQKTFIGGLYHQVFLIMNVSLLATFYSGLVMVWQNESFILNPKAVFPILYLSIFVMAMAMVFYTYAIQNSTKTSSLANLTYVTPVVATVLLILFLGDKPNENIIFGIMLIVTSNILIHSRYKYINASQGLIISIVIFGVLIYFIERKAVVYFDGGTEVTTGIFAIVSGFILSRLIEKNNQENEIFIEIGNKLQTLRYNILFQCEKLNLSKTEYENKHDDLLRYLVDFDFSNDQIMDNLLLNKVNDKTRNLFQYIHSRFDIGFETESEVREVISKWLLLRSSRMSFGEKLAVWALAFISVYLLIYSGTSSFAGDITILLLSATIFLICLIIRDIDLNRPERNFNQFIISQSIFNNSPYDYYLPLDVFEKDMFPHPVREKMKFRVFDKDNKKFELKTVDPQLNYEHYFKYIICTIVFVVIATVYAFKYNILN